MSRNRFPSPPPPSRPERRPENQTLGAAEPLLKPTAAPAPMPDGARFLPVPGTLAESHFGLGMVIAGAIRRRGFDPEKFLAAGYLKAVPSYA